MLFFYRKFFIYLNCLWILFTIFGYFFFLTPYSFSMALRSENALSQETREEIPGLKIYHYQMDCFGQDPTIGPLIEELERSRNLPSAKKQACDVLQKKLKEEKRDVYNLFDIGRAFENYGGEEDNILASLRFESALQEDFHPHHRILFAWLLKRNPFSTDKQKSYALNFLKSQIEIYKCEDLPSTSSYSCPTQRMLIDVFLALGTRHHNEIISRKLINRLNLLDNNEPPEKRAILITLKQFFEERRRTPIQILIDIAEVYDKHGQTDEKRFASSELELALKKRPMGDADKVLIVKLLMTLSPDHEKRMKALYSLTASGKSVSSLYDRVLDDLDSMRDSFKKLMTLVDVIFTYGNPQQKEQIVQYTCSLANDPALPFREMREVTNLLKRMTGERSLSIRNAWLSVTPSKVNVTMVSPGGNLDYLNYMNDIISILHSGNPEEKQRAARILLDCFVAGNHHNDRYRDLALNALFSSPEKKVREEAAEVCWNISSYYNAPTETIAKYLLLSLKNGSSVRQQRAFNSLLQHCRRHDGFSIHPVRALTALFSPQSNQEKEKVSTLLFSGYKSGNIPLIYQVPALIYISQNGNPHCREEGLREIAIHERDRLDDAKVLLSLM